MDSARPRARRASAHPAERAPLGRLAERARLLAAADAGAGAGSSSAKLSGARPPGAGELLWIAGVGDGLVARPTPDLVALPLASLLALVAREELRDAELLAALARRRLAFAIPGHAAETLVHGLVPATHVDLTCPDAAMAICDAAAGARLARECFGAGAAWVPFERHGLALAREVADAVVAGARLVLLAKRGLVTWGETAEECHAATVAARERAAAFVAARSWTPRWGGPTLAPVGARRRAALLRRLLPLLRRELSHGAPRALALDDSKQMLSFLCARDAPTLADAGPASPRQVALTKRVPLWVDCDPARDDEGELAQRIACGLVRYRARARWELAVCGGRGTALLDADPRVVLIGGVGLVAAAETAARAQRVVHAYRHAIETMAGASALDRFAPATPVECAAFLPAPP